MKQQRLGNKEVSAIGIGCMNVSWIWSNGAALDPVQRLESAIPAIHAGLDAGITLLDTADIYAPTWDDVGHNEVFVAEALRTWSELRSKRPRFSLPPKAVSPEAKAKSGVETEALIISCVQQKPRHFDSGLSS